MGYVVSRSTSKFGDYAIHVEWQQHKSGKYQFKTAKKDRKKVGELRLYPAAKVAEFLLNKRSEDLIYCKGAWSIPKSLLLLLRCLGSPDVVIVVSNGDLYQISFSDLMERKYDSEDRKLISYCFAKFEDFAFTKGSPESVASTMMIGKWK